MPHPSLRLTGIQMKYNKEIIEVLFPFLDKKLEDEYTLIKAGQSQLPSNERQQVIGLCLQLEEERS